MAKKRPIKQKEWMTITEASRYLSEISDEGIVSTTDILQFAMDREIMLSIRTTTPTTAAIWMAEISPFDDYSEAERKAHEEAEEKATVNKRLVMTTVIEDQIFFGNEVHQEPLWPGIWDINSFGSGEEFFTRLWSLLQKSPDSDASYLLPEEPRLINYNGDRIKFGPHLELVNRRVGIIYSLPTHLIPPESYLIIRREQLQKLFEDNNAEKSAAVPFSTTERNTLYKMILGMAMQKYGFNPESRRNTATGENTGSICADLEKAGLPVDADTIREHLKAAYAATPPEKS